jgi:hypothetical protein
MTIELNSSMAAMMRSLSSCLDLTRMWRSTERVSLEKKPSTRLSQDPCLGREGEFEATFGLVGEPCPGLLGDVRGMIVEDQLDLRMGRVGSVDELEKFDEFAAAMAVPDEGVDLAGQEIDAGQQADRTMALVLVIACEGCVPARFGRKVRGQHIDASQVRLAAAFRTIAQALARALLDALLQGSHEQMRMLDVRGRDG